MTENEHRYYMALQWLAGYLDSKAAGTLWTEQNRTAVLRQINGALSERVARVSVAISPGIYRCSCVDGCSRCNGTGTIVYLIGDGDPRDAPIERWMAESGVEPGVVLIGEEEGARAP